MIRRSEPETIRIGLIAVMTAILGLVAALNLQKLPWLSGTGFVAEFSDASGLRVGSMVQVAGIRVGRVDSVEIEKAHVLVSFDVQPGVALGSTTGASIEVLNVLGEKFLRLEPQGAGNLEAGARIPLERTESSYDIVRVFSDLSDTTEQIDLPQLRTALGTVTDTMNQSSGEAEAAFTGLSRLSQMVAARDQQLDELLEHAEQVSGILDARRNDMVTLMDRSDLLLEELHTRRKAIHGLLVNTQRLSTQLRGTIRDNEKQIGPMLDELNDLIRFLTGQEDRIRATLEAVGPYIKTLGNVVGTGPWYDATAVNLLGVGTGEFAPGWDG